VSLAQRFDRAISLAAVLLVLMTIGTAIHWMNKRPAGHERGGTVVTGKRVVIDETGGAARVDYILVVESGEVQVPADVYQRAAVGSRVERKGDGWVVTPH